jgi:hypothetical protein
MDGSLVRVVMRRRDAGYGCLRMPDCKRAAIDAAMHVFSEGNVEEISTVLYAMLCAASSVQMARFGCPPLLTPSPLRTTLVDLLMQTQTTPSRLVQSTR